jgi:hypothetical protein
VVISAESKTTQREIVTPFMLGNAQKFTPSELLKAGKSYRQGHNLLMLVRTDFHAYANQNQHQIANAPTLFHHTLQLQRVIPPIIHTKFPTRVRFENKGVCAADEL